MQASNNSRAGPGKEGVQDMLDNINLRILAALSGAWGLALRRDEGQTLVEYALILVVISLGVLAAMTVLRDKLRTTFNGIAGAL